MNRIRGEKDKEYIKCIYIYIYIYIYRERERDPDVGKDWRQEEKGTTEDEMVGCNYQLDGHEFGQAPGVGDGQGSLTCFSPWGRKELALTERLNWTELIYMYVWIYKALWQHGGMELGGKWAGGLGWRGHICLWPIHVDFGKSHHNIVR